MKNIEEQLKIEMSRANIDFVVNEIIQDISLLDQVWDLVFIGKPPIQMRATWAIEKIAAKFPEILDKKMSKIIKFLPESPNDGTRRILVKLLLIGNIPKKYQGKAYGICFDWFFLKHSSIGVKAYSLEVLYKIAQENPELLNELVLVLEGIEENSQAALLAKKRNITKSILNRTK